VVSDNTQRNTPHCKRCPFDKKIAKKNRRRSVPHSAQVCKCSGGIAVRCVELQNAHNYVMTETRHYARFAELCKKYAVMRIITITHSQTVPRTTPSDNSIDRPKYVLYWRLRYPDIPPGHVPFSDISPSLFTRCRTTPLLPPLANRKNIPLTCTGLIAVDRLGSGVTG